MLHRLRLAHRLLLIYLLSFVSVAVLAYGLVAEKNIAIDFAFRELRGAAYTAIVRDALFAIIDDRVATSPRLSQNESALRDALRAQAAAIDAAEKHYGQDMDTAPQAYRLASLLRQLSEHGQSSAAQDSAMKAASLLISRIGDNSNLILDPDLDSYYLMSVDILRLPELTTTAINLLDAARAVMPGSTGTDASRVNLLLKEGAFAATFRALSSDNDRAIAKSAHIHSRRLLQTSFDSVRRAVADYSGDLRKFSEAPRSVGQKALETVLQPLIFSTSRYWRDAATELDRLLRERIDRLYRRMAVDLGMAALVWLVALGLILIISRQITYGESALARRNALLDAITYAATRLVGAADWKSPMPEFFSRLGKAIDVSRVFLFEIHPAPDGAGRAQSCRFMWSAPGVKEVTDNRFLQNVAIPETGDSQVAEWFDCRNRGEVIQITRSQTRSDARILFEETDTFSMLSVPIMINGSYWGSLGFDDCRSERLWDAMEIDLLKTATALIAGAIQRTLGDQRLRERDNQLTGAQRIAHVGSWQYDFDSDKVTWSEEGWRIFGLEPVGSWTYAENLERIHPDDQRRVTNVHASAIETGLLFDIEYRIVRRGGEIRKVHERGEPSFDETGKPIGLIGTVHDITELKATEARLRESEERYALAARGADVGLWDWDIAADRAYLSPRLHEILKVADRDLGQSISGLFDEILPEDLVALRKHLEGRYARKWPRFEFEVRTRTPVNVTRWLVLHGLIVYDGARPIRLVGSVADITDRKLSQEELVRHREALFQSEKMAMFGTLLAGVAHELNNPLSIVIGQIDLMLQTISDTAVAKRIERIRNAAERCARIVRTFLAMARQRHTDPKPANLNSIVEMAVELLAYQLRLANVHVELDLEQDLPTIAADSDQIQQVLTNLIINARQALLATAADRKIQITTRFDSHLRQVEISVADNGPGVPKNIRQRIFEPFFTTKPVGEGTGIGLSLCASIVRAHGGRIEVSERPGGGAVFTIALPQRAVDTLLPPDADHGHAPAGLRVLIVEDEAEIAATFEEILRRNGDQADIAVNGNEGLRRALSVDYDFILSDIRMPLLDGPSLYEALRRERPQMLDRIAFVTGDALSPEIRSFLTRTGVVNLEKPFSASDVLHLLSEAMKRRQTASGRAGGQARQAF
jgi:PAS domain S-box-containing protein